MTIVWPLITADEALVVKIMQHFACVQSDKGNFISAFAEGTLLFFLNLTFLITGITRAFNQECNHV